MIVNSKNFPHVAKAFRLIEIDNGGHLIGTVYPGKKIDLENFEVPAAYEGLLERADQAIGRLSEDDLDTFIGGEQTEVDQIAHRTLNLSIAHRLLNFYFNGWADEFEPRSGGD